MFVGITTVYVAQYIEESFGRCQFESDEMCRCFFLRRGMQSLYLKGSLALSQCAMR